MCNGGKSQDQALSESAQKQLQLHPLQKDFWLLFFFLPEVKKSCSRELFHPFTFDLTKQATSAIRSLIPQLQNDGDVRDWQMIKDIQATFSLIVELTVDFDTLHGLSLRALN